MIIIGLTGGIGHGKTTFAEDLSTTVTTHRHWESSEVISEVANDLRSENVVHPAPDNIAAINEWLRPLPTILASRVHANTNLVTLELTEERVTQQPENYDKLFRYLGEMQSRPELAHIAITPENKELFRPLQQWLGGYLVAKLGGIWYDEIVRRIRNYPELELATVGGLRFQSDAAALRQAGGQIIKVIRPQVEEQDMNDLTERDRNSIVPDSTVYNDGTLEQLTECGKRVMADISNNVLSKEYRATTF